MTSNFSVNCKGLKVAQSDLENMSKDIKTLADKLKDCRQNLLTCGLQQSDINEAISRVWQDIFKEACAMTSLQSVLDNIVASYIQCEKVILNDISMQNLNTSPDSGEKGTDKRSVWEKLWDAIFGKDKPDSYTATTNEQREAADAEMQKRINELLDSDKYSAEAWQNATNEEKKQMLQEYMNDLEKILGVDVEDEVNFEYEEAKDGIIEMASYTRSKNRININSYVIDKYISSDTYVLFKSVTHEMRHAYQYAAVKNPTDYQVDSETIEAWQNSFDNYVSYDGNYDGYKEQEVETDAKWFVDPQ